LAMVMMVMVVLTILGMALLSLSVAETKQVSNQEKRMKAHYLAQAGADSVAEHIIDNPSSINALNGKKSAPNSSLSNVNESFEVEVTELGNGTIELKSIADVRGVKDTATLSLSKLTALDVFKHVVFSNGNLDISGMDEVTGDIGTNGTITVGNADRGPDDQNFEDLDWHLDAPDFPTLTPQSYNDEDTISADGEYSTIETNPSSTLTFVTTPGNKLRIVVANLLIKGNIEVTGEGTLELYIKNSAEFQTPRLVNDGDPNKVLIFLADGSTLRLSSGMEFMGYIFGPGADITEWSGAKITGAVVANNFSANGNPSLHYIEPSDTLDTTDIIIGYKRDNWK
jgi:type II secretory pathway pseudopilin PulG